MNPAAPPPTPARTPAPPRFALVLLALAFAPVLLGLDWRTAGSPALDDHIFLRRIALGGAFGWFDGLGHDVYWRPLSRQAEFLLLGPWLDRAPWVVPVAHAALLFASALLLFAALRRALPDGAAAVAAMFPLALEASRTVLAFATGMQDLMALAGLSLALFAASRGRLALAIVGALAGLLGKEVVLPALLLLPLAPFAALAGRRRRWALGLGATIAAWAAAYAVVRQSAGFESVRGQLTAEHTLGAWPALVARALAMGVADGLNLLEAPASSGLLLGAIALVVVPAGAWRARRAPLDDPSRTSASFAAWGAAVFALTMLPMAAMLPAWLEFRLLVPSLGLGLALAPLAALAHRHAAWALAAVRLAGLVLAPPPAAAPAAYDDSGWALGYAKLARLQHLTRETRAAFLAAKPDDFRGGTLVLHQFPRGVMVFVDHAWAPQLWARDTTVRHQSLQQWRASGASGPVVVLQFQPGSPPAVAPVVPAALVALDQAADSLNAERWSGALAALDRAEAAQGDPRAWVLRSQIDARRAVAEQHLGLAAESRASIARAIGRYPAGTDPRFVAAQLELTLQTGDTRAVSSPAR